MWDDNIEIKEKYFSLTWENFVVSFQIFLLFIFPLISSTIYSLINFVNCMLHIDNEFSETQNNGMGGSIKLSRWK